MKKFFNWIESLNALDLYGVEDVPQGTANLPPGDEPIQQLSTSRMMGFLMKKTLNGKPAQERFDDEIRWGHTTGATRIKITPNGNVVIGRQTNNLQGNTVWVCKRVYKINDSDFAGKEDALANDIMKRVEDTAKEPIDGGMRNWKNLVDLVKETAKELQGSIPGLFMYEDIKKVNDTNYIIYFSLRGVGQGKIVRRRFRAGYSPFLDIDMSYDNDTGFIRVILTTTTIEAEGGAWDVDIPFFDEKFAPTQKSEEVIRAIITTLRYF